jgi:hypothetical protein
MPAFFGRRVAIMADSEIWYGRERTLSFPPCGEKDEKLKYKPWGNYPGQLHLIRSYSAKRLSWQAENGPPRWPQRSAGLEKRGK